MSKNRQSFTQHNISNSKVPEYGVSSISNLNKWRVNFLNKNMLENYEGFFFSKNTSNVKLQLPWKRGCEVWSRIFMLENVIFKFFKVKIAIGGK